MYITTKTKLKQNDSDKINTKLFYVPYFGKEGRSLSCGSFLIKKKHERKVLLVDKGT